jgi:hypothetical protein
LLIDQVRAGLLFLLLMVHGVFAMPWFHEIKASSLNRPEAIEELRQWRELVVSLGVEMDQDTFNQRLMEISAALAAPQKRLKSSLRPLLKWTGTGQGWGLFVSPDTYPHRLIVEGQNPKTKRFELIYRRLDEEHDWWDARFRYRRLRGIYDGATSRPGKVYTTFSRWVATAAFEEYPQYETVRVGFIRTHSVVPGAERDTRNPRRLLRTFRRDEVSP